MARRVILDMQYTFTPSTRTVVIPRFVPRERLLLITNVRTNTVIYNFSDPSLTATSYTFTAGANGSANPITTVVLSFNTTSMLSTDPLQIVVDEVEETFVPGEAFIDPVGKMRISAPQSLIDTDFEYGLQPTKWETLTLINNKSSFFVDTQTPLTITNVTATNGSDQVVVSTTTPPAVGTPFVLQDSLFGGANGPFLVESVVAGTSFTFTARHNFTGTTGTIFDAAMTQVYTGRFYSGAPYTLAAQPVVSGNTVVVTTTGAHGLQIGDGVYITNSSISGSNPPNGSHFVSTVANSTVFSVTPSLAPSGTITNAVVSPRPDGLYIHRPFDGGVNFTVGNQAHNIQTIRQTRRYFRYQSGKGIQMSSGTLLQPVYTVDDLSASGTTVTVTTKQAHYFGPGATVTISGAADNNYNGTFTIATVIDAFKFTYVANAAPTISPDTGVSSCAITSWFGAQSRLGMFDAQNGMFFEYDGQQLYAVRRTSTFQLSGWVNVTNGSSTVTGATINGVTTKFARQLIPGDFIVIRGQSYRVEHITSDTSLQISPVYRGTSLTGANVTTVTKTIDTKIPRSQWNIDRLDGTGPSEHTLDLSKMQMWIIDYSWYGAGTIRYGVRDQQGRIYYCHRIVNNNFNTEAFMRSGNLPARYETNTFSPVTTLAASMTSGDTSMSVANTSGFPSAGTLLVADPVSYEYVNYTGRTGTTFTGLTRGRGTSSIASVTTTNGSAVVTTASSLTGVQPGQFVTGTGIPRGTFIFSVNTGAGSMVLSQAATASGSITLFVQAAGSAAANHTFSAAAPIAVYLHSPQFAPALNHWGTSVIMDGRYDDDKSLQFTFGETSATSVTAGATVPLMSLRVAPSVDSGIPGALGVRELINRTQLLLAGIDVLVSGSFIINLVLNGTVAAGSGSLGTFGRIATGTSSLAQVADHTGAATITGGESMYSFFAVNSAGATNLSVINQDLRSLRDLGNAILGGGTTNTPGTGIYPDGPDVVTVVATNIGASTANVQTRLSWTEAQA